LAEKKNSGPTVVGSVSDELFAEKSFSAFKKPTLSRAPEFGSGLLALPRVRKLARERNIDLEKIKGTGPGGIIREEDLG